MKKIILGLGLSLALVTTILAQTNPQYTTTLYRSAFAKEQISVGTLVKTLTSSIYNPTITGVAPNRSRAEFADIECDTNPIRFWNTSDSPTSGNGITLFAGTVLTLQGYHDIVNFNAVSANGSTVICNIQYSRFLTNTP